MRFTRGYVLVGMALLLSVLFASCAPEGLRKSSRAPLVIFPPPPDTTRIQFLTSISRSTDITGKRSRFMEYVLGKQPEEEIVKPYGLAISSGKLYICDPGLGGMEIIDLAERSFRRFLPGGRGLLKKPINCAVDKRGFLYVADAARREVVVFNSALEYVTAIGGAELQKPTDVMVVGDTIWIADIQGHRIRVYSATTFTPLFAFPDLPPKTPGFLYQPTNLYVIDDRVYVSDFGDFRVKIYTTGGEFLRAVGSFGRRPGQFVRPKGIAVDREYHLYVVDAGFENVQIFDDQGRILMFFGGSYKGPGGMWLPAKVALDYQNLRYFEHFVDPEFKLKYLIFVTNQYGPDKINVYGFVEPKHLSLR